MQVRHDQEEQKFKKTDQEWLKQYNKSEDSLIIYSKYYS